MKKWSMAFGFITGFLAFLCIDLTVGYFRQDDSNIEPRALVTHQMTGHRSMVVALPWWPDKQVYTVDRSGKYSLYYPSELEWNGWAHREYEIADPPVKCSCGLPLGSNRPYVHSVHP